jgi:predicted dehydrogenase
MKKLNVAIIGYKFMGRAYSNAWLKASRFFDLSYMPVLKVACHAVVDFLRAIDQGIRIEPDFRDGIRILKVLETGLQSAESGQRVQIG